MLDEFIKGLYLWMVNRGIFGWWNLGMLVNCFFINFVIGM